MSDQPKMYYTRNRRRDEEASIIKPITFRTKLTDVNDDCLEKIFMHLSFEDLLNIAHTNKKLKTVADMVFAHKFGKTSFQLDIWMFRHYEIPETVCRYILINDLKTALRILRCYGHLISHLSIRFLKPFPTAPVKVLHYTNLYCSETLKSIQFSNLVNHIFQTSMEKPFLKVEVVKFSSCVLRENLMKLNTWFPAMRRLDLFCCSIVDPSIIENHFPLLEELKIYHGFDGKRIFTPEDVMAAFRLNPQLRRISLNGKYFSKHFQSVSQLLPVLEHLTIRIYPDNLSSATHFKSVKSLKIDFNENHDWQTPVPRINMSFDQLEEVEMDMHEYKIIDEIFEFFKKHSSITKLTISSYDQSVLGMEKLLRMAAILPLLNDIALHCVEFSASDIIQFLTMSKSMIKVCFDITNSAEFDHLKTTLGDEWEASINITHVTLNRRT